MTISGTSNDARSSTVYDGPAAQQALTSRPENSLVLPVPSADYKQLVELKNGKVFFRQKVLSSEKMSETMQEIVQFRSFFEQYGRESSFPLETIPDAYLPLIAKLTHESDKGLGSLAKYIQKALQPSELDTIEADGGASQVSLKVIENAVAVVASRVNYGIDWIDKPAASLSIWRWEVNRDRYDLLPSSARDKFEARLIEREQAKRDLRILFDSFPQNEKESLSRTSKNVGKVDSISSSINNENEPDSTLPNIIALEENESFMNVKKLTNRFRATDPASAAKAEKKATKKEKELKEKEVQRTIMSAFFTKHKDASKAAPTSTIQSSDPSSSKSDFEKTFQQFVIKKDSVMAPINWFEHQRRYEGIIEVDAIEPSQGVTHATARSTKAHVEDEDLKDLFQRYIAEVSSTASRRRRSTEVPHAKYLKSASTYCVREIMSRVLEAEVQGDVTTVRNLQNILKSRAKIPAKVLIFHEDTRPGYFGTFTKSSAVVGPRSPCARDAVMFDYSYDSEEDWEEEEENGDDVASVCGSDEGDPGEAASDLDDWLIDDDDVEPSTPLSDREGSPGFPFPGTESTTKRKAIPAESAKEHKKRKIVPLAPFHKGLYWESKIGHCEYELFTPYRIQLFNDTPFPIDPFKFVSEPVVPQDRSSSKPTFVVPGFPASAQLPPDGVGPSLPAGLDQAGLVASQSLSNTRRKAAIVPPPKSLFPDALLPYLTDKITSLGSASLTWVVESCYQDLKTHKVKKNAIEAKVREITEKCSVRKIWVVRDDVLRSLGKEPVPPNDV